MFSKSASSSPVKPSAFSSQTTAPARALRRSLSVSTQDSSYAAFPQAQGLTDTEEIRRSADEESPFSPGKITVRIEKLLVIPPPTTSDRPTDGNNGSVFVGNDFPEEWSPGCSYLTGRLTRKRREELDISPLMGGAGSPTKKPKISVSRNDISAPVPSKELWAAYGLDATPCKFGNCSSKLVFTHFLFGGGGGKA